jgi:hypothetical protein
VIYSISTPLRTNVEKTDLPTKCVCGATANMLMSDVSVNLLKLVEFLILEKNFF